MQINHWLYVAEILRSDDGGSWRWLVRRQGAAEILFWGQKPTQEEAISSAAAGLDLLCSRSA